MSKLYGGGSKPDDVELLSAYGAQLSWLNLTTDLGQRKVFDTDAYRQTLESLESQQLDKQRVDAELDTIPDRRRHLRQRRLAAESAADLTGVRRLNASLDDVEDESWKLNLQRTRRTERITELPWRAMTSGRTPVRSCAWLMT